MIGLASLVRASAFSALAAIPLTAQQASPGPLVSGEWLEQRLGDPGILVLHIDGSRASYDAGHIPGARFALLSSLSLLGGPAYEALPTEDIDASLEAVGVDDDVHVVITAGSLLVATRAWLTLDYLGHGDHASILDGGTQSWQAAGRRMVTDTPAASVGSLTPRPRADVLADSDWITAHLEDPAVAIIDGRRKEQYTGEDGGMGGRFSAGHMPGASWLGWELTVSPDDEDPTFLPLDQLRALFEEAGADEDLTVLAYCTIGTRASLTYFVGRMLGYDMRLYEGSWHEWSSLELPFVTGKDRDGGPEQEPGPLVSGDWLQARLGDPAILVLHIDSRPDRYAAGHIAGARFIAQSAIALNDDPGLEMPGPDSLDAALEAAGVSDAQHIIITTHSPLAATRMWLTFDYLGHGDHVSILDGGLTRWEADGRPLVTDAPETTRGSFTPRPRTGLLVDADWIAARLDDPDMTLIDARPDDEYTGTDGGMGGRVNPGHIPGAAQLYWEELIESRRTDPSFLPIEEMRAKFEAAGAGEGQTVVTYCMIGARASLTYFVGRMLGYDMRFYDGSWHDWGSRDLPFVSGRSRR